MSDSIARLVPIAKKMAETVNGGIWETHYTPAQKAGWVLKAAYAVEHLRDDAIGHAGFSVEGADHRSVFDDAKCGLTLPPEDGA